MKKKPKKKVVKKVVRVTTKQHLENMREQISILTNSVNLLAKRIVADRREIENLKFQRPPVETIRTLMQKTVEEPRTGSEEILKWTTDQVNKHLAGLAGDDLKDIVQSALTGKPIVEKDHKYHPDGTQGEMAKWLNANISTVNTQENVWNAIDKAQDTARERFGLITKEAREDWARTTKNNPDLKQALALADVDTPKTKEELKLCLRNTSTGLVIPEPAEGYPDIDMECDI